MGIFKIFDILCRPMQILGIILFVFSWVFLWLMAVHILPDYAPVAFGMMVVGPVLWVAFKIVDGFYLHNTKDDFYYKDFGYFTANINKLFTNWTESSDSELKVPKCKVKVIKNRTPLKGKTTISSHTSSSTTWNGPTRTVTTTTREKYFKTDVVVFFEITYMEFDSEADYTSFSQKGNFDKIFGSGKGALDYFHKNNIHIVCDVYCRDLSGNPFNDQVFTQEKDNIRYFMDVDSFLSQSALRFKRSVVLKD